MSEQERETPYKGINDFYKTLNDEQRKKVIDKSKKFFTVVRCAGDVANLVSELTEGYIFGEVLGIKKEKQYTPQQEQTQEQKQE